MAQFDWSNLAEKRPCTFFDDRPNSNEISLLVIHNISLPAGCFGTPYVDDLFTGQLDCQAHKSFADLEGVEVSAHCFIRRNGHVYQYVPFSKRAWHAGVSEFRGQKRCNDFSIGIELEGTDNQAYTNEQYECLSNLTRQILAAFPAITCNRIVGHCDIAPTRKTDPGAAFEWQRFLDSIK